MIYAVRGIGREAPRNRGTRTGASQVRVASPEPTRASGCLASHCGEVPLLPYESCNLASINLSHMVRREGAGASIDWEKLGATARLVIRFLDDVLEVGRWPDPRITAMTRANRKVGLGMMGFAGVARHPLIPQRNGGDGRHPPSSCEAGIPVKMLPPGSSRSSRGDGCRNCWFTPRKPSFLSSFFLNTLDTPATIDIFVHHCSCEYSR